MSQSISQNALSLGDLFIPTTPAKETHDLLVFDKADKQGDVTPWAFIKDRPLETCYDLLCDNATFQVYLSF